MLFAGGQQNGQDAASLEKRIEHEWSVTQSKINSSSWKIGILMSGINFTLPISQSGRLFSSSYLLFGACKTAIPAFNGITYQGSSTIPNGSFDMSKIALPWAFCYQASTGLGFKITKSIDLVTDLTYFNGHPNWKSQRWSNAPNLPQVFKPIDVKYSLSSMNILVGAKIKF